jgi:hypothetical protein
MVNHIFAIVILSVIPFIFLVFANTLAILPSAEAARYFTQYSAVTLSFLGGVHWYDAISNNRKTHQYYIAMLPVLMGWIGLVFNGHLWVLSMLSVCYLAVLLYDKFYLFMPKSLVVDYIKLRMLFTTVVVISHGAIIMQLN